MKFPMKLAKKIKNLFIIDSLNSFYQEIIQKVILDMKKHSRKGSEGYYVPNDYQILISRDNKEKITKLNDEDKSKIRKSIAEELAKKDFKLRGDLEVKFATKDNLEQDILVNGEFALNQFDLDYTENGGTKIFKVPDNMSNNFSSANHTVRLKPLCERECYLRLLDNEEEVKRFEINSVETNIGRQENNEVVLIDSKVSRVHAQIIKKDYYYLLNDLKSTNGIFVNNQLLENKRLVDGDKIRLGESELEFCLKM